MEAWEVTDSPNMNRPGSLRAPEGTKYGLFHRAPALPLRVTFLHCGQHYFGICAQILTSDPLLCPLWPWNKYKNMQDLKTPKRLASVVFSIPLPRSGLRNVNSNQRGLRFWFAFCVCASEKFVEGNIKESKRANFCHGHRPRALTLNSCWHLPTWEGDFSVLNIHILHIFNSEIILPSR